MKTAICWTATACLTGGLITPILLSPSALAAEQRQDTSLRSDVNADGYVDTITATRLAHHRVRLTVHFRHGKTSHRTVRLDPSVSLGRLHMRRGEMDGHRGEEIVYNARRDGQHFVERALTWRGDLVDLAGPGGGAWNFTASPGTIVGYRRHIRSDDRVLVHRMSAVRHGSRFTITDRAYVWLGHWKPIGKVRTRTASRPEGVYAGFIGYWNGLPRRVPGMPGTSAHLG